MPTVRTTMQLLLDALKVRPTVEFVDYTAAPEDGIDATGGGAGMLEAPRPRRFSQSQQQSRPQSSPAPEPSEIDILTAKIIKEGVPVSRNGVPIEGERKDGAKAIIYTLEQMLDPKEFQVTHTFKINTAQVLFLIYTRTNDIEVKTKALNLLIKLTKDNDIDVSAESCKKLLGIVNGGHYEEPHLDPAIKSLSEAKGTLDPTDHSELIAEIDHLLTNS